MPHDLVDGYLHAADVASALLAAPAVGELWHRPSALPHWSVAGLSGHLARSVFTVHAALSAPVDPRQPVVDAVAYYAVVPDEDLEPASEVSAHIRSRGLESAGADHADLVERYEAGLAQLRQALPTIDPERPVATFGRVLPLVQCLRTRTLELVVHADDLATSLGRQPPVFAESVINDVIAILAAVATRRRGSQVVLRALARPERVSSRIAAF